MQVSNTCATFYLTLIITLSSSRNQSLMKYINSEDTNLEYMVLLILYTIKIELKLNLTCSNECLEHYVAALLFIKCK